MRMNKKKYIYKRPLRIDENCLIWRNSELHRLIIKKSLDIRWTGISFPSKRIPVKGKEIRL